MSPSINDSKRMTRKQRSVLATWFQERNRAIEHGGVGFDEDRWAEITMTIRYLRRHYSYTDYDLRCLFIWAWRVLYPKLDAQGAGATLCSPYDLLPHIEQFQMWYDSTKGAIEAGRLDEVAVPQVEVSTEDVMALRRAVHSQL